MQPYGDHTEYKRLYDFENLVDVEGEMSWTCPNCLHRNDEDPCDGLWDGDWSREGEMTLTCQECDRNQVFSYEWSPNFTPVVNGRSR